jgi:hypothetical protein
MACSQPSRTPGKSGGASLESALDVDEHGRWACQLCPDRGTGLKDSRPWKPQGRVHQRCLKKLQRAGGKRSASSAFTAAEPVEPPPAAAASAAPGGQSLEVVQSESAYNASPIRKQFSDFGYARVPPTSASCKFAWKVLQQSQRAEKEPIAGHVKQLVLPALTKDGELGMEWDALVRATATVVGIDVAELFVVDTKLLIAPPKKGKQPVHWDTARTRDAAVKYSIILFCSNGCYSTALPTFPANDDLSFSDDSTKMKAVAQLIDDGCYESQPVESGAIVIFRQSTPHFGVANTMPQGNRVVLFSMLSPLNQWGQDQKQVMPWLYVGYAFGWESRQFAQALVTSKEHSALEKVERDQGKANHQIALACLRRWGLEKAYFA